MQRNLEMLRRRAWLGWAIRERIGAKARAIVWTDGGDEVLVHLDTFGVETERGVLVAHADLEADEVGRECLVASFALGVDDAGKLVGATQGIPQGAGVLAARWGATFESAVLKALDDLVTMSRRQGWWPLLLLSLGKVLRQGERR